MKTLSNEIPKEYEIDNGITISARDLRINNWVKLGTQKDPEQVIDVLCDCINTWNEKCAPYDWVDPIPLNEEWLFKFGFKEQESDIPTFAKVFGQIIEDDYEHCLIINKDIDDNFFVIVMGIKIIFKYVHQIQNFYFVLSEEELTIEGNK
jgi:hypothetical protein